MSRHADDLDMSVDAALLGVRALPKADQLTECELRVLQLMAEDSINAEPNACVS